MKILVTGGTGKLGSELKKIFPNHLFPTSRELDIRDTKNIAKYLLKFKPDIIIHTAAITDVRLCEEDKKHAWDTNYLGTQNLIKESEKLDKKPYFIYISTACVFSGDDGPYFEDSIPNPKNFYSLTKLLGEIAVTSSSLAKKLIIRTNFIDKDKWPYEKAFIDRYATYLYTDDVAKKIRILIKNKMTGVKHVCGNKKMSMYEIAKIINPKVGKITLKEYKGPELTVDMSLKTRF